MCFLKKIFLYIFDIPICEAYTLGQPIYDEQVVYKATTEQITIAVEMKEQTRVYPI